jgi:hypothetical protein
MGKLVLQVALLKSLFRVPSFYFSTITLFIETTSEICIQKKSLNLPDHLRHANVSFCYCREIQCSNIPRDLCADSPRNYVCQALSWVKFIFFILVSPFPHPSDGILGPHRLTSQFTIHIHLNIHRRHKISAIVWLELNKQAWVNTDRWLDRTIMTS